MLASVSGWDGASVPVRREVAVQRCPVVPNARCLSDQGISIPNYKAGADLPIKEVRDKSLFDPSAVETECKQK